MGPQSHLILTALLGAQWLMFWRLALRLSPAKVSPAPAPEAMDVSIVIPARDEEANLPVLLRSIEALTLRPLEVIVVDDGSRDATAEVARRHGATVVQPGRMPPEWRGKTWACQQGAEHARGTHLLFLDADTWFEGTEALGLLLKGYPGGAWSLIPWHRTGRPAEAFSAFFNLMMALGTIPGGLAGPCLLVPRETYLAAGGHGSVKDRILENVHLGAVLRKRGTATACAVGHGTLAFRMYPGGLRDLIAGWSKGFTGGAASTPGRTLVLISVWISSLFIAAGALFLSPWSLGLYAAYAVQLHWMLRNVGSFPWWTAVFYPVPLVFYLVVFIRALGPAGKRATWKGRKVAGDAV